MEKEKKKQLLHYRNATYGTEIVIRTGRGLDSLRTWPSYEVSAGSITHVCVDLAGATWPLASARMRTSVALR